MKKLTLPVFALLACVLSIVVLAGVFAGNGEAAIQPSPPASPPVQPIPTPTPTPPPGLTPVEFQEFVGSLCNNSQIWSVGYTHLADDWLHIFWDAYQYKGPHTGPPYDGHTLTFRVERTVAEHKMEPLPKWERVADVDNWYSWDGPAERGEWIYRVTPFSVSLQGHTMGCYELI